MDESDNLYAAPQSEIVDLSIQPAKKLIPVSKMRRFVNYLLDSIFQFVLATIIITPIMIIAGEDVLNGIPDFVLGTLILFGYYVIFEGLFSLTPAKLITGTRVVNEQGLRPSFSQIVGRSLSRIIPFEPFSFLGQTGRGWHDSWSKTYVISVRS